MPRTDDTDEIVLPQCPFGVETLGQVRDMVHREVLRVGLQPADAFRFVQAIGEALANAIEHGGEARFVVVGRARGCLRAEVHDSGRAARIYIPRQPPSPEHDGGRGLWLMSQLADGLEICMTRDGTTVRIEVALNW